MLDALFIADEPIEASLMHVFLKRAKKEGLNLLQANSLKLGVRMLKLKRFDVILLNFSFKEMKDPETILNQLLAIKDIPIIVCTNSLENNQQVHEINPDLHAFIIRSPAQVCSLMHQIKYMVESIRKSKTDHLMFVRNLD